VEPFAGGAIASLTAVFEDLAARVVMCEIDPYVAAVWRVILEDAGWLVDRILSFRMEAQAVRELLKANPVDLREKAFQTIVRNRVQRGGIMAPGASLMKWGENGRGLASRWYPQTLAKRIMDIYEKRDRITFVEGDGFELIHRFMRDNQAVFFVDPPYTAGGKRAGRRLYTYNDIDHPALFELMVQVAGPFLMTYEDTTEVVDLAYAHGFSVRRVAMKNTHHNKLYELLITPRPWP
jgi:DNA adenine methylase